MTKKYLDQSTVDVTFNAWWDEGQRSPSSIGWALQKTKEQIGGPMPPNYVPPPKRDRSKIKAKVASKASQTDADGHQVRAYKQIGAEKLRLDFKQMAAARYPNLPPEVAREIMFLGCSVDPKVHEARLYEIVKRNWSKIEAHNKHPVASQGPRRDIDKEYEQREKQRQAVRAIQRTSIVFSGPKGKQLAEQVLANKHAMMLLDQQYLANSTFAGGFYGVARAMGADHDYAMDIGRLAQNSFDLAGSFAAPKSTPSASTRRPTTTHRPMASHRSGKAPATSYVRQSGMPKKHFEAFRKTAKSEKKIVLVRPTKLASIKLIEQGAPSKGIDLSKAGIKCSTTTGVATANGQAQAKSARKLGYYVVDADGKARDASGNVLNFKSKPAWTLKPGQVIDKKSQMPVVGDYDLLDVIDPKAMGPTAGACHVQRQDTTGSIKPNGQFVSQGRQ